MLVPWVKFVGILLAAKFGGSENSNVLPADKQTTIFLPKGAIKSYRFSSTVENGSLSITVVTCPHPIRMSVKLNRNDSSAAVYPIEIGPVFDVDEALTTNFTSREGVYILDFFPAHDDTHLNVYVGTEIGGPAVFQQEKHSKITVHKKRKELVVKWRPSLVDPQNTEYCLIIDNKQLFKTLCLTNRNREPKKSDGVYPRKICVGEKLQCRLKADSGESRYFSLFATNKQSNLTYLYGTETSTGRSKPSALKDGKWTLANLKKTGGEVNFKYRVAKTGGNVVRMFIISCESGLKLKIYRRDKVILTRNLTKHNVILLNTLENGYKYNIKLKTSAKDVDNNSRIQILVTSKSQFEFPFPQMPNDTRIIEYKSLKTCSSVTIGWLVPPQTKSAHYCFFVKEKDENETAFDKCGLRRRITDFVVHYCKEIDHQNQKVLIEKVAYLAPGKNYVIQVVVKKPYLKSLSYDLFQTSTLRSCKKY
ncbi:unnamed protein product [Phyllotreta striolata]|uniref:Protein NDNF C-terminal domain-containing protein n=1 Tax=Phyllotreta striolata TaxID=444603 RepID=A0A9P0GUP0_PHYSR|nr:unnamed protein product [Phyllotreta striolata]